MSDCFQFAEFELDLGAYALRCGDERVKLEKLPMEVLILLARSPGVLLERREIQAALWGPDVFVDRDSAINTAVRKIRQALGDDAETPRFVETVVGKGYRFIAAVERRESFAQRSENGINSSSTGTRRAFPSYCVTRGSDEFILEAGETVFGRDPASGVYVEHLSVSRHHARLSIGSDEAVLEDLKSRNGTFLDGRRIKEPTRVSNGAIIGLGLITFTFRVLCAPASTRPISAD